MNDLFALVPKAWRDLGGMMAHRWWAGLTSQSSGAIGLVGAAPRSGSNAKAAMMPRTARFIVVNLS